MYEPPVATFASRLKKAMELREVSAADISRKVDISTAAISRYLKGAYKPKQDKIYSLSKYLRVSPTWLMGFDVDMEATQPKETGLCLHTIINQSPEFYSEALEKLKQSLRKQAEEAIITINEAEASLHGSVLKKIPPETTQIPIIASVKCGYDGVAYEYQEGSVFVDSSSYHGEIKAFRCYGDSMSGIGIFDGDIAVIRIQDEVESGELAIVIIDGEEGTLKRVRKQEGAIILESANPSCPPRVFTGEDMNNVKIVGKVIEIRRKF
jgi:repressor LexA